MATDRGIGDWGIYLCRIYQGLRGRSIQTDPYQVIDPEALLDRCHMLVDTTCAQAKFGGNGLELVPLRHQRKHLALARGQHRQVGVRGIVSAFQALALPGGKARPLR